jgi:hypothetical protein
MTTSPEYVWRAEPAHPLTDAVVLIVPPLFDEANKMRRTLVQLGRTLAARGVAACIPDLPGQNESLIPTVDATMDDWQAALARHVAAHPGRVLLASVRGGALIDHAASAAAWWRLSPTQGANLLRTMLRTKIASEREAGVDTNMESLRESANHAPIELAGNVLSPTMVAQLDAAVAQENVAPLRTVTLGTGEGKIAGSALWLRSEPGEDAALVSAMADDIIDWMRTCDLI